MLGSGKQQANRMMKTRTMLAAAYLAVMFVWHRLRVSRRRAAGPTLELLRRFDYRVVWDELLPAMPDRPSAAAPSSAAPAAPASSP